ncbi:UDP-N-acetylmuramate--L-alanine ligase [Salinispira pacifica]|uniref:UDP-N-acetylmuramate--L-alanine ligase n=1 Tax=Salinispira pacifica TaxID=1307761 RepID=V5WKK7_9SPIO|nr:UDP-N-acetylmuramate--L-alanine ligase [Salinispira pacifica]AHC16074.1 UDP-N-acetylmuramate--alanine ligase [Salinispira pacifica]
MIGIKGTGMAALAELLVHEGAEVSGSDVADQFYTDAILKKNSIPVFQGFDANQVPYDAELIIYSSAYDPQTHPELQRVLTLELPMMEYSAALAAYSRSIPFAAVAGVHGKTTTTAMIGTMIRRLELPAKVLVGSGVSNFQGSPTYSGGNDFFVAETCEYRRHFLNFNPQVCLITSIEADHLDYFENEADVRFAFTQLMEKLPPGGTVVYCADDPGAKQTVESYASGNPGLNYIPYGFSSGETELEPLRSYRISNHRVESGSQSFTLERVPGAVQPRNPDSVGRPVSGEPARRDIRLQYPGVHSVLNAAGALALLESIVSLGGESAGSIGFDDLSDALGQFTGTTRRSEVVGQAKGITIIDDYAHHPRAIAGTLQGFRDFYPGRRIVVDFMSHTYSRTFALKDEFAQCFQAADVLVLNDIYASAREENRWGIRGEDLAEAVSRNHSHVHYIPDFSGAAEFAQKHLQSGDIFVTMGAGDNWRVGRMVLNALEARSS